MKNNPSAKEKSTVQFDSGNGGTIERGTTGFLPDGTYFFEDKLEIKGFLMAMVVTGEAWLFELYQLHTGEIYFESGMKTIYPEAASFGVLFSPFSISRPCFRDVAGQLSGFASTAALPDKFKSGPFLLGTPVDEPPGSSEQIVELLNNCQNLRSIEIDSPSTNSLKAKQLIDANFLDYPSIGRVARRIGISHEHLSRGFKRDFGLSPSEYLHKIRVSDANLKLARGEEIISVSMDVGYNDLGRFYKQFRKIMESSPGNCQTKKKRN